MLSGKSSDNSFNGWIDKKYIKRYIFQNHIVIVKTK